MRAIVALALGLAALAWLAGMLARPVGAEDDLGRVVIYPYLGF